eukprot:2229696-Prymnesium_polylepis.1
MSGGGGEGGELGGCAPEGASGGAGDSGASPRGRGSRLGTREVGAYGPEFPATCHYDRSKEFRERASLPSFAE